MKLKPLNLILAILLTSFAGCKSATFFETPNKLSNITGTLYLNNGKQIDGKLLIDMDYSKRNAVKIIPAGEKETVRYHLDEIQGYETRGTYYALKEIRNNISVGKNYSFMKRLTPAGSRIQLYQNMEEETTRSYRRYNSNTNTTVRNDYFMQFPKERGDGVWALSSSKFTPNFDEKMSRLVSDCPRLAAKIANKEDAYFYRQVSSTEKQAEVLLTIISEYNNCR